MQSGHLPVNSPRIVTFLLSCNVVEEQKFKQFELLEYKHNDTEGNMFFVLTLNFYDDLMKGQCRFILHTGLQSTRSFF